MQPKHIAIVRAALTYWDEEMGSQSESVYRHYLHSLDNGTAFTPIDIANVRREFNKATLRYALFDTDARELVPDSLVDDASALVAKSHQRVITALL